MYLLHLCSHFTDHFSAARSALTSPLLRLPAELRINVWNYVVLDQTYFLDDVEWIDDTVVEGFANILPPSPTPCWLGLLQTCCQVNNEITSLPLTLNALSTFSADTFDLLVDRLASPPGPIYKPEFDIGLRFWSRPGRLCIAEKCAQFVLLEVTFHPDSRERVKLVVAES